MDRVSSCLTRTRRQTPTTGACLSRTNAGKRGMNAVAGLVSHARPTWGELAPAWSGSGRTPAALKVGGRPEGGRTMIAPIRRPCANPACSCEPSDGGCSPWCLALDRPAGEWCRCGHEACAPTAARGLPATPPTRIDWRMMTREAGTASPQWLVVVRRDEPELYPAARRRFDEPLCLVVLDQRRSDRRLGRMPVGTDRRRGERRQALTPQDAEQWLRSGYRLVCRAEVAWPQAGRTREAGPRRRAGGEP